MKSRIYILALGLLMPFLLTSCLDDDDDNSWRDDNEKFYEKLTKNSEYERVNIPGATDGVLYKELQKGEGAEYPEYTGQVKIRYKGFFYNGSVFDKGTTASDDPETTTNWYNVNDFIYGFAIALQGMVVGDKWEVWVPWPLGYGDSYSGNIPGYSTLGFEIELVEIKNHP